MFPYAQHLQAQESLETDSGIQIVTLNSRKNYLWLNFRGKGPEATRD